MNNKTLELLSATVSILGLVGGLASWFTSGITGNVIGVSNAVGSGAFLILIGIVGSFFWTYFKGKGAVKKKSRVIKRKPKRVVKKKKKR